MRLKAMEITIFGILTFHLLFAMSGMKNMAGSVPSPNADIAKVEFKILVVPRAFVNPTYTNPHGKSPFASPKLKER